MGLMGLEEAEYRCFPGLMAKIPQSLILYLGLRVCVDRGS